jgi:PilZ domain
MNSHSSNSAAINNRRSKRLLLQISVFVIAVQADKQQVREVAQTLVVSAHGCLIDLTMKLEIGQLVTVKNVDGEQEQSARVASLNAVANGKTEVGIEFLAPAAHFWRVKPPPADWLEHDPVAVAKRS